MHILYAIIRIESRQRRKQGRHKRNRKQGKTLKTIILLTAILNLFTALLMLFTTISKLLE